MVVFGDAEFISNGEVSGDNANFDLAASSIEWMAERGFVGPRPQERSLYMIAPDANVARMVFGSFWTFTALFFVFGSCIWIARRR